jgi:flagellin-like hook-associated protein FlgL
VQSAAVLAAVSYSSSDPNAEASYAALTTRTSSALSFTGTQSVEDVVTDLGLKSATLDTSKTNLQTQISTSQTLLDNTQNADTYEVATKLTSLVTQLQASYQVTSALSKLSLANYL